MAKRFKLRISRVITSLQSCRSKDPSTLSTLHPLPSFFRLNSPPKHIPLRYDDHMPITSERHHSHRSSSFKRHVSSAFSCGCGAKSDASGDDDTATKPQEYFQWQKQEEEWHVVPKVHDDDEEVPRQKIYNSSVSSGDSSDNDILAPPKPPPPVAEKKKRRTKKKKPTTTAGGGLGKHRMSTSSADSGLFSSEERELREETETLVSSSRSFSTDSSTEFNPQLETIREKPLTATTRRYKKKKTKKMDTSAATSKRSVSCRIPVSSSAAECESSPARLSVFKKLIPCAVEGKVKESFAVVKKSEDPFEDFKRSMMEMICEKQMFEENELELLLQCFLSLNSRQHHAVIIHAFSHIWNDMFSTLTTTTSN